MTITNPSQFILLWSAKTEGASRAVSKQLLDVWEKTQDAAALHSLCWTMGTHRTLLPERAAVVGDATTIATALKRHSEGEMCADVIRSTALEHGSRPVCFVFCGQGAQWSGMGMDCCEAMPVYNTTLLECARIVKKLGGWDLLEKIRSDEVNTTRVSQPATTAVQLALVEQLKAWGICASAAVGHSSGEICAAYTAGTVTLEEAMELRENGIQAPILVLGPVPLHQVEVAVEHRLTLQVSSLAMAAAFDQVAARMGRTAFHSVFTL